MALFTLAESATNGALVKGLLHESPQFWTQDQLRDQLNLSVAEV